MKADDDMAKINDFVVCFANVDGMGSGGRQALTRDI